MEENRDQFLNRLGHALEERFFAEHNARQLQLYREKKTVIETKEKIGRRFGLKDDSVVARLIDMGFNERNIETIFLIPAVTIAWADGVVDDEEREVVRSTIRDFGIVNDEANALVETWLRERPQHRLLAIWHEFMTAILPHLSLDDVAQLKARTLSPAVLVGHATGGVLGLGGKQSAIEAEKISNFLEVFAKQNANRDPETKEGVMGAGTSVFQQEFPSSNLFEGQRIDLDSELEVTQKIEAVVGKSVFSEGAREFGKIVDVYCDKTGRPRLVSIRVKRKFASFHKPVFVVANQLIKYAHDYIVLKKGTILTSPKAKRLRKLLSIRDRKDFFESGGAMILAEMRNENGDRIRPHY